MCWETEDATQRRDYSGTCPSLPETAKQREAPGRPGTMAHTPRDDDDDDDDDDTSHMMSHTCAGTTLFLFSYLSLPNSHSGGCDPDPGTR